MEKFIIFSDKTTKEDLRELNITISAKSRVYNGVKLFSDICIKENSEIFSNAQIHSNSIISGSKIFENAKIFSSRIIDSVIGENAQVGPFSLISGSIVEADSRVGNFSEVINSKLNKNVKVKTLCSIRNSELEENRIFESGTIIEGVRVEKLANMLKN